MPASDLAEKFKLELTIPGVDQRNLPTERFMIFSVLFVALYTMLVVYFVIPQAKNALVSYNKLQSAKKENETYREREQRINLILGSDNYKNNIGQVDQILYNNNPYVEVLMAITQLADQHQLTLSGLEYSPGYVATPSASLTQTSSEESYPINFSASGTYADIVGFLSDIEMQSPFNSVSNSTISNDPEAMTATAQIEILAQYHLPRVLVDVDTELQELSADELQILATLSDFKPSQNRVTADTIDPEKSKIDLFALEDIGLTITQDPELEQQVYVDPVTGELFIYQDADTLTVPGDEITDLDSQLLLTQ